MEIGQYFNILIKRLWIIILFTLIGSMASAYYSYSSYKPSYVSSATVLLANSENNKEYPVTISDLMVGQELVKEYREIIISRTVTTEVAKELNYSDLSPAVIENSINVTLKDQTRLLIISANSRIPERAKQIVDKVYQVFVKKISKLPIYTNVILIDEAEIPTAPIPPNHIKKMLIGLLAGFLGSIAIIFVLEELDDTVKSADDVEKALGLKVLGNIPTLKLK